MDVSRRVTELLSIRKSRADKRSAKLTTHPITGMPLIPTDIYDVFPAGATRRQIAAFERHVKLRLPKDLCEWLSITNGPAGFYGISPTKKDRDVLTVWKRYPEWRHSLHWFPVADDGFGNYYVQLLDYTGPKGSPIGFVDVLHSTEHIAYIVSSNMITCAVFLLEEELALRDTSEPWPFDRDYVLHIDPDIMLLTDLTLPWSIPTTTSGKTKKK